MPLTQQKIRKKIYSRIFKMIKDKDSLFMYLNADVLSALIEEGYIQIDSENKDNMSGTKLTKKGKKYLKENITIKFGLN